MKSAFASLLLLMGLFLGCTLRTGGGSQTVIIRLGTPRAAGHTATLLLDGRVLVAGGISSASSPAATASAELVDPSTGTSEALPPMSSTRRWHSATRLADGRVLLAGGTPWDGDVLALDSAEIYDPTTHRFLPTATPMAFPRHSHTATLLQSGEVLITGGDGPQHDQVLGSAELFDPATGRFTLLPSPMARPRTRHGAALLDSGRVLVAGGVDWTSGYHLSGEIYDPSSRTFRLLASTLVSTPAPSDGIRLDGGKVLFITDRSAELFDPVGESFVPTGTPLRSQAWDLLLPSPHGGAVLLGGPSTPRTDPQASSTFVEVYAPGPAAFQEAGTLSEARKDAAALLLTNGRVLVVGGTDAGGRLLGDAEAVSLP